MISLSLRISGRQKDRRLREGLSSSLGALAALLPLFIPLLSFNFLDNHSPFLYFLSMIGKGSLFLLTHPDFFVCRGLKRLREGMGGGRE
jgi:hypothetical protein